MIGNWSRFNTRRPHALAISLNAGNPFDWVAPSARAKNRSKRQSFHAKRRSRGNVWIHRVGSHVRRFGENMTVHRFKRFLTRGGFRKA